MIYLWIDPALADTGIVWRYDNGHIGSKMIHTEPTSNKRESLFKRWEGIAEDVKEVLHEELPLGSMKIGMYAPIVPRGKTRVEKHPLLPMVSGICYGIACTRSVDMPILRDDKELKDTLRKLGYRIPIVAKEGKGAITRYVRSGLWPECRNSHEGDARLGLEYLMITDGAIAPNPKETP